MTEAIQTNPAAVLIAHEMQALAGRQDRYRELVRVTPLLPAPSSLQSGYEVYVKNEGDQTGGAYKTRGAYNRLLVAQENNEGPAGVTAASTGNYLRGVAIAAVHLGVAEVVGFCPEGTVQEKIVAAEALGVRIKRAPDLKRAAKAAAAYAARNNMLFAHPFNHPAVIAGNGMAAVEAVEQLAAMGVDVQDPRTEVTVMIPGGGGGLASGSVVGLAALYPTVRSMVVQQRGGDNIVRAMRGERPLGADKFIYSCRGAAVVEPGDLALQVLTDKRFGVLGMSVTPGEIGWAMRRLGRLAPESAGALAMAGVTRYAETHPVKANDGKRHILVAIMSGANVGTDERVEFAAAAETERQAKLAAAQEAFGQLSRQQLVHPTPMPPGTYLNAPTTKTVRPFRGPLNVIGRPTV